MKNPVKILGYLIIGISFTSCTPKYLSMTAIPTDKIETAALFASYVRIQQATGINIYTPIINSKTNSIENELISLFHEKASLLRDSITSTLKANLSCKILSGNALHNMPNYDKLKDKYNFEAGLATGRKHFPDIQISENDFNLFNIEKEGIVLNGKKEETRAIISEICKELHLDFFIVSETILFVTEGSMILKGTLSSQNNLYLFDKNGKYLGTGFNMNPGVSFEASDIIPYETMLSNSASLFLPEIKELALRLNKN